MQAVILAGGRGTRLESVTHGRLPKPMAELAGRPVLEHIVRLLAENGFTDLCCTLACMPECIRDYFGDGSRFGVRMEYRVEQEPLGTAGAVKNCRDFTGSRDFLVISGDAACDFDLRALFEAHRRHGCAVTMALSPHEAPLPYGLAVTDSGGFVRSFIEKPRWERVVTDLVNTGIYVLTPAALAPVPENTPFDFARDLFPRLLEQGQRLFGLPMAGYWRDIGDPLSYYRANLDAWEGRLRLPGGVPFSPAPKPAAAPAPGRRSYACRVFCGTPHRARLMRELSRDLMEAGADFADGLSLPREAGGLHISPCPERDAVCLESDDPGTLRRYEALIRRLERDGPRP